MLIIVCFTIIGCKDSSNNTNNSSNANVGVLRDLSVNLEKNYSVPDSDCNVIELASTPDELYQNDLKKLISISDDVIRVTVQNVAYTSHRTSFRFAKNRGFLRQSLKSLTCKRNNNIR